MIAVVVMARLEICRIAWIVCGFDRVHIAQITGATATEVVLLSLGWCAQRIARSVCGVTAEERRQEFVVVQTVLSQTGNLIAGHIALLNLPLCVLGGSSVM